jgi:hypothetical protein
MMWHDVLLDRKIDRGRLERALAEAFDVPLQDVVVVESIADAADGTPVIVEESALRGEFRCLLSVYASNELAQARPAEVVQRLARTLQVRALISDASDNPFSMVLLDGTAAPRAVFLDAQSLSERDEYRLSGPVKRG